MSKNNKKHVPRNREKTLSIFCTAAKHGITPQYVYGILNGQYNSERALEIKAYYEDKYREIKKTLAL